MLYEESDLFSNTQTSIFAYIYISIYVSLYICTISDILLPACVMPSCILFRSNLALSFLSPTAQFSPDITVRLSPWYSWFQIYLRQKEFWQSLDKDEFDSFFLLFPDVVQKFFKETFFLLIFLFQRKCLGH